MRTFQRIFVIIFVVIGLLFLGANVCLLSFYDAKDNRQYRIEVNRIALEIAKKEEDNVDLSGYTYVTNVEKDNGKNEFYNVNSDYIMREIGGEIYRFDYQRTKETDKNKMLFLVNVILGIMALLIIGVMIYLRQKILLPFERLMEVPYELSKGNLTVPIKEEKSRFFGRFAWGMDLLREHMEKQKKRELDLQKDRKTLLLSISHDIKTPLSAIKLYSKALSKGLYPQKEKQLEIAENINAKADEIEGFLSEFIHALREDFLSFDVKMEEFYLEEMMERIKGYYGEKLALVKTEFMMGHYSNCLIKGDLDRSIEVLQNVMENAIKYGDGRKIEITVSYEENNILVAIKNSGCNLEETELPHIFESFWRGSNASHSKGSGLGLSICRQLMHKMGGEIFVEIQDEWMNVMMVFETAA